MDNREKIIQAIEKAKRQSEEYAQDTIIIPFREADMILALLKEQETSNTGKDRLFQCKKCGYGFDDIFLTDEHNYDIEPNYCPNCGRLVRLNA